jgi:two-component system CheB/CheR fusion protein
VAKRNRQGTQLVVIGSSAGGIEALSRVVAGLPTDFGAPIIVAQHLDPRRPSHLGEILHRHSTLPVRTAEHGERLEDGVIFVIPSNRLVDIVDHTIVLRPAEIGSIAPSVDRVLETAARAYGPGLIAVILTGSGSDGSAGAWHVKAAGGLIVIEDPATAKFPSMPRSISPLLVDATADLESMGGALAEMLATDGHEPSGGEAREFRALLDWVHRNGGADFTTYKPATILRRLRGRMIANSDTSIDAYRRRLEADPEEYARLLNSLLIKVTEFFRDPDVFAHVQEKVLPGLIEDARRTGQQLRLWSAGCATGEEAYSLAISAIEAMHDGGAAVDLRVFATDIDRDAVAYARRGLYPETAIQNLPDAIRERYFIETDSGYEVGKPLRSAVVFGEHDLGGRAPFPRIDLVLCRNVLIYFAVPMQRATLETFAYSLREGGYLVLGPSETVSPLPGPYREEPGRMRIFRRLPGNSPLPMTRAPIPRPSRPAEFPLDSAIRTTRQDIRTAADLSEAAEALLLDLTIGVVVVDRRYDIVRINTAARRILGIHGLAFDQDFIHLAESLPSTPVRSAIDGAIGGEASDAVYEVEPVEVGAVGSRFIHVHVRPYVQGSSTITGAVIEVSDVTDREAARRAADDVERRLERAATVNRHLHDANDELTALVAQLRLANQAMLQSSEEAQAGREEVETLNEEAQATNEELETLNEELTASVDELRTANDELAARTADLRTRTAALEEQRQRREEEHSRLQSVLKSLGDAVLAVDRAGDTIAANNAYDRFFGGSRGVFRPEDLAGLPLPPSEWPQQRAARGERFRMEFAVSDDDGSRRWFEAVAEPLMSEDRTWGGVVAIRDVSERTMRLSLERLMASAGHELTTPTAAIHNYLQLVERNLAAGDTDAAATYAARGMEQSQRLSTLIERLLDVSRIQTGQMALAFEATDLRAVIQSAVEVARVQPDAPPIVMKGGRTRVLVWADPARLEQVVLNLLINAVEHGTGTATIEVAFNTEDDEAKFVVRDHGPGVPPAELRSIFEPYKRLGEPHHGSGLGLGLFVAREIVTAHGGRITASSRQGKGTVITVWLRLAGRHADADAPVGGGAPGNDPSADQETPGAETDGAKSSRNARSQSKAAVRATAREP